VIRILIAQADCAGVGQRTVAGAAYGKWPPELQDDMMFLYRAQSCREKEAAACRFSAA